MDLSSQIGTVSLSVFDSHWRYKLRAVVLEDITQFLCYSNECNKLRERPKGKLIVVRALVGNSVD